MDSTKEKNGSYKDDLLLRMGLNDNKAGMEGLDKDKINKIIMEATKGSRFYGNELKKEKQVNQRIENMMQQKAQITSQQLRKAQLQVKEILADYDPNFLAMSLDEAYLNITKHLQERQNWPEDKRKYFIKTGNPLENDKPRKEVNKLREHERSISPLLFDDSPPDLQSQGNPLQGNSEEEDNPQTLQNSIVFGTSAEEVVKEIRFRIEQKTTLTASAGIAPNTMLAKVCSDKNKPNGQYQVLPNRQAVMDFIKDLPIRKVSGIGKVTEKMLKALGIITCTELYQQRALLSLLFSETSWHHFLHISLGLGSTHLARDGERKSMSVERTFSEISKAEEQYNLCQELCSELAQDLQKEGLKGRTVTIKLKNVNFEVKTRASTVSSVVSTTEEIFAIAKELLRTEIDADFPHPLRLRLMGVRLSSFPNEEDKRHQQRSIIGFLQAGNQSQSAPGCILEKTDKDQFLKSLEMSHKKSFFDKKRSERNWSHQDTFKCEAVDKQSLQTSHSFQVLKKKMNENLKTSENSNNSQIFTCPICFREQRSISLEAFNKHVDACLDGPSISGISSVFSHSHASSTEVNKKENVYPSFSQSEKQDYETHQRNSEINFIELPETEDNPAKAESVDALSDKHSKEECASLPSKPFNIEKCCQNSSSTVSLEDIASLSRQESSQPYLQALVCPVCNLEQKTSDLTLFNVHVDVCLNKGIIQELRKDKVNLANQPRENTKSTDNSGRVQKTATKPKRPGLMTKYSASKKTKPNNSRHTLDVFFK
ncbi:DNA polymerase kappa isoform X4 [Canis lupus familiaris]|uniref:DNA polymerase kappa isoform X4 n=1 Tax=Canis lupus familiaris TaxID=9615 RepID=UPI0003AE1B84|nr:DNA polymerase kappa isoform X4 [Canis lupus familiaris]XP_025293221.1 DNA polymerase kappa isoform X4 [Canis lupus dingo]XP_038516958.1 DNA polymerase kappa isoform X4 [Canis lupus familiaris]|eukprot:XP_013967749.1 DNA polymerase kappa isoform X3 [Canis lupus familiaris]